MSIHLKTREEIELMRQASMIVYEVHQALGEMVRPGVSTLELNAKADEICKRHRAIPAFLGYPSATPGVGPFPGVICASRNEVIVHGIPSNEPLCAGDILSIDFGCSYQGYFGDAAVTYAIGDVSETAERLLRVTAQGLEEGIKQCRSGRRIGDISAAVQGAVEQNGFGIVREFVGHGIGRQMHEPPHVPNFGRAGQGRLLKPGMVLAIEPMVTVGSYETKILSDGWTAVTRDGSLSAHFEHTVAITEEGPYVLTRP
jgi:methionyl aminopeptidase